jgi:hypothetical protein
MCNTIKIADNKYLTNNINFLFSKHFSKNVLESKKVAETGNRLTKTQYYSLRSMNSSNYYFIKSPLESNAFIVREIQLARQS